MGGVELKLEFGLGKIGVDVGCINLKKKNILQLGFDFWFDSMCMCYHGRGANRTQQPERRARLAFAVATS